METQLGDARNRVRDYYAAQRADLVRDRKITREEALADLARRFPELTPDQVERLFNRGMFLSR